jgi:hypothetical protein
MNISNFILIFKSDFFQLSALTIYLPFVDTCSRSKTFFPFYLLPDNYRKQNKTIYKI